MCISKNSSTPSNDSNGACYRIGVHVEKTREKWKNEPRIAQDKKKCWCESLSVFSVSSALEMDKNKNYKSPCQNYHDLDDNRNDLRKQAGQEKFAPAQAPTASIVPQLWNPRHMLGFEEFKVNKPD